MSGFDIGNVYSATTRDDKVYYIAIKQKTLITCRNGRFGEYTTHKRRIVLENNVSVADLCDHWKIQMLAFDEYMAKHFAPDDTAQERVRREKGS